MVTVAVQHLIAAGLVIAVPAWDVAATRRLRRGGPLARRRGYAEVIAVLWSVAAVVAVAVPARLLWTSPVPPAALHLPVGVVGGPVVYGVCGGLAVGLAVPVLLARWVPDVGRRFARGLEPLAYFLPATAPDRRWFVAVSVTAGVCEEVVYRGFLIRYLHAGPWAASPAVAVVVAAAVFGLAHGYQGVRGVLLTALVGVGLTGLFLLSGNLAVPILAHAALDLRLLWLWPRPVTIPAP